MPYQAKGDNMSLVHRIHSEKNGPNLEANLPGYITEIKAFLAQENVFTKGKRVRLCCKEINRNNVKTVRGEYIVEDTKHEGQPNFTIQINGEFVSPNNMKHIKSVFSNKDHYINHIGRELNRQIIRFGLQKYFEYEGGSGGITLDNPYGGGYRPESTTRVSA